MRKYLFFSWILAVVLLLSCSDDKNEQAEQTPFNQPTNEVKVYTETEANYVSEEATENELVFGSNTPDNLLPQVGTIIQMPISENTPYGFLGRVTDVKKGDKIVVTTKEVALDEAYPNLSVDTIVNSIDELQGVYDEDGNPVEYEIITLDSTDINNATRAGGTAELEDRNGQKVIRVKIDNDWGEYRVGGHLSFGLGFVKNGFDCKDGLKYMDLEANPYIDAKVQIKAKIASTKDKPKRSKRVKFTYRFVAGPVIIPVTVYANFVIGARGEITTTNTLQFQKSCHCYVKYINNNWSKGIESTGKYDGNPWLISEFDFNGEVYAGVECGVIFGLYTATTGVGINLLPKVSLSAEANINSINPFKVNPKVSIAGKLESSIYCIAELFGMKLAKWELILPEYTFINRSYSLFPNIDNFEAIGGSSSAEISYQSDTHYFLEHLGVKTGTRVYESDKRTEVSTVLLNSNRSDRLGNRYYNTNVSGLNAGSTYYAAPVINFWGFTWAGDMQEFTTEASYRFDFRCQGQSYDIISFYFNLNDANSNSFLVTAEGQDYNNGPFFNAIIKGKLNKGSNTLEGTVEMNFIGLPEQRRIDAFSIPLGSNGYVNTTKVLDNGACYTAIRITNNSNSNARTISNYGVLLESDSDCNVGLSIH